MPVYISQPLDRSQTTSQIFKDHGIKSGAPVGVSNARITCFSFNNHPNLYMSYNMLWAYVSSFLLEKDVLVTTQGFDALRGKKATIPLFQNPPLVITVADKSETTVGRLTTLGFLPQSTQRYQYYQGPATQESIRDVVTLGAAVDCYTPYGTTNVNGLLLLSIINRLLYSALGFTGHLEVDNMIPNEGRVTSASWEAPFITKESHVTGKGIFFPYFDGLVLTDKAFVPRVLCDFFVRAMGSTPDAQAKAAELVLDGWSSLSTTPAGLAISHIVLGLDLGRQTRVRVRPVVLSGRYSGFLLEGERFAVLEKGVKHTPQAPEIVQAQILEMDKHSLNLIEIAAVLSEIPLDGDLKEKKVIDPDMITSPRILHYMLKSRTIDASTQQSLRPLIEDLSFAQEFWATTDSSKLNAAVRHITHREWLPEGAPFAYKLAGVLFTKDPIHSTLAAFGIRAPTLCAPQTNLAIAIESKPGFYKKVKQCSFRGIPYYVKPLQQAYEDWSSLLKTKVIQIKHAGNDRMGIAKLPGVHGSIPFDNQAAKDIEANLVWLAKQQGKRARVDEGEKEQDAEGEAAKRSKRAGKQRAAGNAGLLGFLPPSEDAGGSSIPVVVANVGEDADMDDWFAEAR